MLEGTDPEAYASAQPFPHVVTSFESPLLSACAAEFRPLADMEAQFDNRNEKKSSESRWAALGPATRELVTAFNGPDFLDELERVTGIAGLLVDPHLWGGGQHQIGRGGLLQVHADFERHPTLDLHRRVNALLYLNEDWRSEWGGQLELWDDDGPAVKVEPEIGTLVVFTTTATSRHGHPGPLQCPPERTRKSLAFYYYTADFVAAASPTTAFVTGDTRRSKVRRSAWHLREAARALR